MRVEFRSLRDQTTVVLLPDASSKLVRVPAATVVKQVALMEQGGPNSAGAILDAVNAALHSLPRLVATGSTESNGTSTGPGSLSATNTLVVSASHFDLPYLLGQEQQASAAGRRFLPIWSAGAIFLAGPLIFPRESVSVSDVYERLLCAANNLAHLEMLLSPPHGANRVATQVEFAWARDAAVAAFNRGGDEPTSRWRVLELDPFRQQIRDHPLLPMPHRAQGADVALPLSHLEDPLLGIITRSEPVRLEASGVQGSAKIYAAQTWVTDLRRITGRTTSALNAGFSYTSRLEAQAIARGEAVERYCGNYLPDTAIYGTEADLQERGLASVRRQDLPLFTAEQYEKGEFPYSAPNSASPTHWVQALSLPYRKEIWYPASWMMLNYYAAGDAGEEPLHPVNYAGIAAGTSLDACLANGIEELVERDCMMAYWLGGSPGVRLPDDPGLAGMLGASKRLHLAGLPNEFGIPVVCAVVEDSELELTVAGYACRSTLASATRKAFSEAVALCETAEDLLRPNGLVWNPVHARLDGVRGRLREYRGDRRYGMDYREDYRDVTSLFAQLQVCLDPSVRSRVREIVIAPSPSETRWCEDFPRSATEYVRRVSAHVPLAYADLTTHDVRSVGFVVTRVASPSFLTNFPTAFPPLGNGRAAMKAEAGRWHTSGTTGYVPNPLPIPYA